MPDTAPAVTPENDELHHAAFHASDRQPDATDEEVAGLAEYTVETDEDAERAEAAGDVDLQPHPDNCDGEC